jgi:3-deoxy-D-manno-octulosonate 8-phosphate phosphatase (KDO 8-P phosphatase)
MRLSGFIGCPADSCQVVKEVADYISPIRGGDGVVRDVKCEIKCVVDIGITRV